MSINARELNLKLKVKEQWFCDYCGDVIDKPKDGMLEWDSFLSEEGPSRAQNFRIVHHRAVKKCRPSHADNHLSDGHLHWYTGPGGLSELLNIEDRYTLDVKEMKEIIKRLHVDYYEEGRKYLPYAREDGEYQIDPFDLGDFSQDDLIWLIKKYGHRHI